MRAFICLLLISTSGWARSPKVVAQCVRPSLMLRTDRLPRSEAFTKGLEAFDLATVDWKKQRYAEAARGFLAASEWFAQDGAEGNWKYAWLNATYSFEAANQAEQGKEAFEAAAAKEKDRARAEALRTAGAQLRADRGCP